MADITPTIGDICKALTINARIISNRTGESFGGVDIAQFLYDNAKKIGNQIFTARGGKLLNLQEYAKIATLLIQLRDALGSELNADTPEGARDLIAIAFKMEKERRSKEAFAELTNFNMIMHTVAASRPENIAAEIKKSIPMTIYSDEDSAYSRVYFYAMRNGSEPYLSDLITVVRNAITNNDHTVDIREIIGKMQPCAKISAGHIAQAYLVVDTFCLITGRESVPYDWK